MSKIPMQQWFPDAHIADTALLNLEQQGAYRLLLDNMWIKGGYIKNDDKEIARMLRITVKKWQKVKPFLEDYLLFFEGNITQKRLIYDYYKVIKNKKDNTENGSKGGQKTKEIWEKLQKVATAQDDLFARAEKRIEGSSRHISEVLPHLELKPEP